MQDEPMRWPADFPGKHDHLPDPERSYGLNSVKEP